MSPKQKIIIAIASFGVFSAIFLGAVLYPIFQGVLGDHKKVLEHKTEFLQLKEDERSSSEFETVSSQYANEFAQLDSLFVDSETPIAFFRFLDETAASFGLRMEKAPGPVGQEPGDSWPSFEVRLAGEGAYPEVMALVQKLENAPYLLEIRTFALAAQKDSGVVEFSLSFKVFTKSL